MKKGVRERNGLSLLERRPKASLFAHLPYCKMVVVVVVE